MSDCLPGAGGHRQQSREEEMERWGWGGSQGLFASLGARWVCVMDTHHVGEILLSVWNDCLFVLLVELPLMPVGLVERVLNGKPRATVIQRWAICPIMWRQLYELFIHLALCWNWNSSKMAHLYGHLVPLYHTDITALVFYCTPSGMSGTQDCKGLV